jgi:hypothetical protein
MCNIYERYRIFANDTQFCFTDLIVEFNENPGDIKIHVENNGIYYYEEDGANFAANERVVFEQVLFNGPGVSLLSFGSLLRHVLLLNVFTPSCFFCQSVTVEDAGGNGFAGGRVIIEVLEEGTTSSPRAMVLEFEGGSFTVLGTENFVVPDNCVVNSQQITDEPTQPTTSEPTPPPVDVTPSPSTVVTSPSPSTAQTPSPSTAETSQPPTTAPMDTTPATTSPGLTLAPTGVPIDMTESPAIPQITVAPKSSSSAPTPGSLSSPQPSKPHYGFLSPKQKHHWKESKKMKRMNVFQMDNEGKGSYSKGKKSIKIHKGSDHYNGHHKNVAFDHKKSWKKHGAYAPDN